MNQIGLQFDDVLVTGDGVGPVTNCVGCGVGGIGTTDVSEISLVTGDGDGPVTDCVDWGVGGIGTTDVSEISPDWQCCDKCFKPAKYIKYI